MRASSSVRVWAGSLCEPNKDEKCGQTAMRPSCIYVSMRLLLYHQLARGYIMEKTQRNPLIVWFSVYFVGILIWNLFLHLYAGETTSTIWNYLYAVGYSLFYIVVAGIGFAKLAKVGVRSAAGKGLLFMSIGATIFTFAFWLYTYFILAKDIEIPYPSVADYFFLSFVPLVAIGFFFLLRIFGPLLTRRVIWETFLLVVVGIGIVFYFTILPQFGENIPTLEKVFNIIYPLDDSILVAL